MSDTKRIKSRKIKGVLISKDDKLKESSINNVTEKNKDLSNKKIKSRKIKMSFIDKEEEKMDKQIELEDNFSMAAMIGILVVCFIVGISLGYILYRIAINSSNAMMLIHYFLK